MSEVDEPVPKLPRGRGMKFSGPQLFRIALLVVTLVGVLVLTRPCANAVSGFVTSFDGSGSGSAKQQAMPKPGNVDIPPEDQQYEQLKPGMTEAEIKAAVERSKARNAGSAAGSASGPSTAGSASGTSKAGSASGTSKAGSASGTSTTPGSANGSSVDPAPAGSTSPVNR